MTAIDAFDKIYRTHRSVAALLTTVADYGETKGIDPTVMISIDSIRELLDTADEAFDVLDHYVEKAAEKECQAVQIIP